MDTITSQYTVPAFRYPGLLAAIEKLNRRARRFKIAEITVKVTGTEIIEKGTKEEPKPVLHNLIEVSGVRPQLAGWEFAATLEHDYETGLTILRTSKAFEAAPIPVEFRHAKPVCDHCHQARNRKDTFLCYSASQGFKQIGRNCLVDFLGGRDPHAIAGAAEIWFDLDTFIQSEDGDDEGWGGSGGSREIVIDLEGFLQRAFAVVRVIGFLGRVKARELQSNLLPTADRVLDILLPSPFQRKSRKWQEEVVATEPTTLDTERVTAALEWVRAFDVQSGKLSDYEHNLYVACASDILPLRRAGIVASLPAAYLKHIDRQAELVKQRAERKPSNFVGNIGDRIEITAKLTKVIAIESEQWGTSYLHKFEADNGDRFAWFSSSQSWDERDEPYTLVGTVKAHKEDEKWGKETQLSRCKEGKAKDKGKKRASEAASASVSPISSTRDDSLTPRIDPREYYTPAF